MLLWFHVLVAVIMLAEVVFNALVVYNLVDQKRSQERLTERITER